MARAQKQREPFPSPQHGDSGAQLIPVPHPWILEFVDRSRKAGGALGDSNSRQGPQANRPESGNEHPKERSRLLVRTETRLYQSVPATRWVSSWRAAPCPELAQSFGRPPVEQGLRSPPWAAVCSVGLEPPRGPEDFRRRRDEIASRIVSEAVEKRELVLEGLDGAFKLWDVLTWPGFLCQW
jgi:hypothetical protein